MTKGVFIKKQESLQGNTSLTILQDEIKTTMKVTHAKAIILEQIRKLTKKDSEAVIRYADYQKDQAEKEKKGRKRRLKQVT